MEYLLRTRRQESEAATKRKEKGIVDDSETAAKRMMPLGLVGEMAEMDSVRWVVMRMKFSMDERVCFLRSDGADGSHPLGLNFKLVSTVLLKLQVCSTRLWKEILMTATSHRRYGCFGPGGR